MSNNAVERMRESGRAYLKKHPGAFGRGGGRSTPTPPKKTEQQLIEEMRESGKQYLKEKPQAFGGGVEAETGIRYSPKGQRLSVALEKPQGQVITPISAPKEKLIYFGDKPTIQERGVFTVSPTQAETLKGTDKVFWTQQSTTPTGAIEESAFVGSTPQIHRPIKTRGLYEYNIKNILAGEETYRQYKKISSDFEADPKSFEGQEGFTKTETKEGIAYGLAPSYFEKQINVSDIYGGAGEQARARFKALPTGTRRKLTISGYGAGVSSAVIGVGEFGGTILLSGTTQTFKEGEGFTGRSMKFGGSLGDIRSYPSTTPTTTFLADPLKYSKQKATSPEFLGGASVVIPLVTLGATSAYKNIKTYGWGTGSAETISAFSPLKIRSGIYAQPITKDTTFKNIQSIKGTKGGITTRVYSGSSGSIQMAGIEKSALAKGKVVGGGQVITRTPFLEIRGGGTSVTQGLRITKAPYTFGSTGTGSAFYGRGGKSFSTLLDTGLKGGTSKIITGKGSTFYISDKSALFTSDPTKAFISTGGGTSKQIGKGVKYFTSGKATPQYKTKYYGELDLNKGTFGRDFIHAPTGKYKLTPQMSGREYDLNIIMGGAKEKGFTSFMGGGKGGKALKQYTTFKDTGLKAVVPITKTTPISKFKPLLIMRPSGQTVTTPTSKYAGLGMYEKTEGGLLIGQEPKTLTEIKTDITPIIRSGSRSQIKPIQKHIAIPKIDTIQKPTQTQIKIPKVIPVRKTLLRQSSRTALDFKTNFGASLTTLKAPTTIRTPTTRIPITTPIPIFPIPFIAGGGRSMGMGKVGSPASSTRYIPSFSALFFKIRGKAPKGQPTGLRFRPITKGFKFIRRIKL